ncbi:MAG: hypothetical protein WBC40_10955 [Halobacteriota archaeon]
MRLNQLTYFIFGINAAIDTGKYGDISIKEVEDHLERGDLIPYLKERLGEDVDLGLLKPEDSWELNDKLLGILGAHYGKERSELGVENNGLCLLIVLTTEIIRVKEWV